LDFSLAYERVLDELRDQPKTGRALAANPFELDLIELDRDTWLDTLAQRVADGLYVPGPIEVCDVPKAGGLVRPGVRLGVADRVAYTAAVGACIKHLDKATRWSQGSCDFATRLNPAKLDQKEWLRNPFRGWQEWHDRSLQRLDSGGVEYVLTADIAGFFENVNIGLLRSDLVRVGCPTLAIDLICRCLNQWVRCPDRGLPQGVMASDILAKLYLEPFDRRVRAESFRHIRYTDDIRLFAGTKEEAQRGLVAITGILRERGLTLQSHKTKIRVKADAREECDGIVPAIQKVRKGYVDEIVAAGLMAADVSLPMAEVDDLASGNIEPEVLHRAFESFVVEHGTPNKSMLNFLLRRLGSQKDDFGVAACAKLLDTHPEYTPSIMRYLQDLSAPDELERVVEGALMSRTSAIYPYQRYLLLDWLNRNAQEVSDSMLAIVRQIAFRPESPEYVQAVAYRLVGQFGTHSDLDEIEARFKSTTEPLKRAQLLCNLRRLEKGRRNGLAARVGRDDGWVGRAASLTRK
jgi:hypothetical protein